MHNLYQHAPMDWMHHATSLGVFIFFAVSLILPSGYSIGAAILLYLSSVLLCTCMKNRLTREEKWLIGTWVFYFLAHVITNLYHAAPMRHYDLAFRFLLIIPIFLLLKAYAFHASAYWAGLAIGAIGAGSLIIWQFFIEGNPRPGGWMNPIQHGNLSLLLGVLCLPGLSWIWTRQHYYLWGGLLITGYILGILGSFLSGSRGGWLVLPVCLSVLLIKPSWRAQRILLVLALLTLLIVGILYKMPGSPIKNRIIETTYQTITYFSQNNKETSIGERFQLWKHGFKMIAKHPWLGWGNAGYLQHNQALMHEGKISPIVSALNHLHNDVLDILVKHGTLGLLALITVYLYPLRLFFCALKRHQQHFLTATYCHHQTLSISGILLIISYIVFGFTQAFLTHNSGTMFFLLTLAIISCLRTSCHGHLHVNNQKASFN